MIFIQRGCFFYFVLFQGYQADKTEEWEDASYIVYQVTDRYGFMQ